MSQEKRLLYPQGKEVTNEKPMNLKFFQDLKLDSVFYDSSNKRTGIPVMDFSQLFSTDPDVCEYRMDIIEDMLNQPKIDELFQKVLPEIEAIYELRKAKADTEDIEVNLNALKEIETYLKVIDLLSSYLLEMKPKSEGLQWFVERVKQISTSEEYEHLKTNSSDMVQQIGGMKSITLGVNLDTSNLTAKEIGVISVNSECFYSGDLIDRLLSARIKKDEYSCLTPLVSTKAAEGGASALFQTVNHAITKIYKRAFQSFSSSVKQYLRCNTDFLIQMYEELLFYHKSYQLLEELRAKGYPICKAILAPKEEKAFHVLEEYNLVLALKFNQPVVRNSITFDEKGRFFLVTGPNHGGKSIFAASIGMVQAMAQLGLYVPACSARISLVDNIFTHVPVEASEDIGKGRFGEECERLSNIMADITADSMLIMDETLSSTSSAEGTYIAKEVLLSIVAIGCRGCFVTHMHELCNQVDEINQSPNHVIQIDHLVAQLEEGKEGKRSYRILRTKPDGLSYARDIAKQYGLVYEVLMKNHGVK